MNKLVKRGLSAYKIFLQNKLVASIMMLFSGVMMFIAALQGKGNDVYSLPILITTLGTVLTAWAVYKFGYLKCEYDKLKFGQKEVKNGKLKELIFQIGETLIYMVVAGLGVFLLSNHGFTDKVLNLMAGFFTTLNGVLGTIRAIKNRDNKDFGWKFMLVLTIIELALGPYFIITSDSIELNWYIVMGALTAIAGTVEVIHATTRGSIRDTIDDGKEIVRIIKNGNENDEDEEEDEEEDD